MASRRSRGVSRPTASQPYDTYPSRARPFRHCGEYAPSFTNIEFEVVKEYQGDVRRPVWLISETGERYSFEVQRDGLGQEEVEVVFERAEPREAGQAASSCANGGFAGSFAARNGAGGACGLGDFPSAGKEENQCLDRALLTIFCSRHCERSLLPAPPGLGGGSRGFNPASSSSSSSGGIHPSISHSWKFGCRFKLPFDASPERATAAHSVGSLTVTVPRLSWSSPWLRVPHIRLGAWSMQIAPSQQHQALDAAARNAAINAAKSVCENHNSGECSCSGSSGVSNGLYSSRGSEWPFAAGTTSSSSAARGASSSSSSSVTSPQPGACCGEAGSSASFIGKTGGWGMLGGAETVGSGGCGRGGGGWSMEDIAVGAGSSSSFSSFAHSQATFHISRSAIPLPLNEGQLSQATGANACFQSADDEEDHMEM